MQSLDQARVFLATKAAETRTNPVFAPSADACRYCPANGACPAQTKFVADKALDGFGSVVETPDTALGDAYAALPLVAVWSKAIQVRVRAALTSGQPVHRSDGRWYKLVEGRMSPRTWSDEEHVAALLSDILGNAAYLPRQMVSPAQVEALATVKRPRKGTAAATPTVPAHAWAELQPYITQSRSQPAIVLDTNLHPEMQPPADGFEEVNG